MSIPVSEEHLCSKCAQPASNFCDNCGGWFCLRHGTPGDLYGVTPPGGMMGRIPIPSACWRDGGYDADVIQGEPQEHNQSVREAYIVKYNKAHGTNYDPKSKDRAS